MNDTPKDDATSIVGRIAGLTSDDPPQAPVTPEQLIEAFCSGRDSDYVGDGYTSTRRDDLCGYTLHRGFCGYNGRRDTKDSLLTGFDDGYDFMGFLEDRGWRAAANYGDWPYVVYLLHASRPVLVEYCEADFSLWEFDSPQHLRGFLASLPRHV